MPELRFKQNEAMEDEGLGHAGIETFKDSPYASLARECGQNSADARANEKEPVLLTFDCINVKADELPSKNDYLKTIDACLDKAKSTGVEKELAFFNGAKNSLSQEFIKVLKIADYKTTGLIGPAKPGTKFDALVKGAGVSAKDNDTSGGSFGIGKNAVYALSDIQTVFYSTVYRAESKDEFLCQGKSILVSHSLDGVDRQATGYWGDGDFKAISDGKSIPELFVRNEVGTSIFLICFRYDEIWKERLIASLVINFFVAITNGKICFKVGGRVVDKHNLYDFFKDEAIKLSAVKNGQEDEFTFSKFLYECLRAPEALERQILLGKEDDGFGKVNVRLLLKDKFTFRIFLMVKTYSHSKKFIY